MPSAHTSMPAIACDSVFILVGAESVLQVTLNRLAGYRCSRREDNAAQLFAQSRTLRIRQVDGLNLSTVIATSPLRADAIPTRRHFHKVSRAAGPKMTKRVIRTYEHCWCKGRSTFWDRLGWTAISGAGA